MKYLTIIIALLFSEANAIAQNSFIINGQLGKDKHGIIFLSYKDAGQRHWDSTSVFNGKFIFKGEIKDPQYATLMLNPPHSDVEAKAHPVDNHDLFIEPGILTVQSDSLLKSALITGSGAGQKELNNYAKQIQPVFDRYQIVRTKLAGLHDNPESTEYKQFLTESASINLKVRAMDSVYAASHLDSYFAFFLWSKYFRKPNEQTQTELNRFSLRIRNTQGAQLIAAKIEIAKRLAPGNSAPDFTLQDSTGKSVMLSAYKGKNVMLLFWFPDFMGFERFSFNIGRINRRLNDKNFVMLTVYYNYGKSMQGTDRWKEIIKNEFLNAVNLEDAGGINGEKLSSVAKSYGITPTGPLPLALLIGPDGNIIENRIDLFDSQIALSLEKKLK
jgi:hypothetical protein